MNTHLIAQFIVLGFTFFMLLNSAAVMVLMERKVAAFVQQRLGPYRVGPWGTMQPLADIIKLMMKEELRPKTADTFLFYLAPILCATAAFAAFAVVPFGADTTLFGLLDEPIKLIAADVNVGVLVLFAITSMGVYGVVLAGWASNSKYSLLGGLRSSAQMISYELSYGLSLAAIIMLAGTLSLREVVDAQAGYWHLFGVLPIPKWYLFIQPVSFVIFMIAGVAETNRAPFDFPEAEQELVAGYHTEYSSMTFALFFMAEYINMVTVAAVSTNLFLGGWHGPFLPAGFGWIWFLAKLFVLLFFYIWMRWTLPRYRYDHLMEFGWKWLLPAATVNLLVTAGVVIGMGVVMDTVFFWVFAVVAIISSLMVVGQRNPMYSVLLLIVSFGALSGLYVLLNAPFMAVVQIIIYAGAIMVLFLFVVMLLNVRTEDDSVDMKQRFGMGPGPRKFGAVLAVLLAVQLIWALRRIADAPFSPMNAEVAAQTSSVNSIGLRLFREYAFAFEATSVLILVAMVGAVILARKDPHHPARKDK